MRRSKGICACGIPNKGASWFPGNDCNPIGSLAVWPPKPCRLQHWEDLCRRQGSLNDVVKKLNDGKDDPPFCSSSGRGWPICPPRYHNGSIYVGGKVEHPGGAQQLYVPPRRPCVDLGMWLVWHSARHLTPMWSPSRALLGAWGHWWHQGETIKGSLDTRLVPTPLVNVSRGNWRLMTMTQFPLPLQSLLSCWVGGAMQPRSHNQQQKPERWTVQAVWRYGP